MSPFFNRQPPSPAMRRTKAFSLIELLIVIALMGVLSGIVLTGFQPSLHDELKAAGHIVASDVQYARSLAVTNNSNYRLTFDADENTITLAHCGSNSALDELPPSPLGAPGDDPAKRVTDLGNLPRLGPGVRLRAVQAGEPPHSVDVLEIGPLGETTRSEPTTVWLAAGKGVESRYLAVAVDPITCTTAVGEVVGHDPME